MTNPSKLMIWKSTVHGGLKRKRNLHLPRKLLLTVLFLGLAGCAEGYYAEDPNLPGDSPYEKAYLDEHSGNDENLGPNSPGYIGPDGEFSMYPDSDPQ